MSALRGARRRAPIAGSGASDPPAALHTAPEAIPNIGSAALTAAQQAIPVLTLLAIGLALAGYQWRAMGDYPPGPDWASWLAFGRWWFGDGTKGDISAYPPLIPVALHGLATMVGAPLAAKLFATGTIVSMVVAAGTTARCCGVPWMLAFAAAGLVGVSGIVTEVMSFAGYPQAYATAAFVLFVPLFVTLLHAPSQRTLASSAAVLAVIALSHHMYFVVAGFAVCCATVTWIIATRPSRDIIWDRAPQIAAVAAVGLSAFAFTAGRLWALGYDAPLGTANLSLEGAMGYALRDAPAFWFGLIAGAFTYAGLSWRRARDAEWQMLAVLLAAPSIMMAVSPEPRLAPPLIVAACVATARCVCELSRQVAAKWLLVPAAVAVPVLLLPTYTDFSRELRNYYQMANGDLFETAEFVDANADDGLVAVRWTRAGWQLGWWFEGLTDERIAVGSDPKWIGFREEQRRAGLVAELFGGELSGSEVSAVARREGITLLVAARFEFEQWRTWQLDASGSSPTIVFENARYLVFEVPGEAQATHRTGVSELPAVRPR